MVKTRFAPSPTGYLHIGGLRTALYAYLYAKKHNGKFVLRIEDTDLERYVDGAVDVIIRDLKLAGLDFDEGPIVGGDCGPYVQSERRHIYTEYAEKLVESGAAYYCFCTRERLKEMHDRGSTKYDKKCAAIPLEEARARVKSGEPYVIRQNLPESGTTTFHDEVFGDVTVDFKDLEDNVLIKSDGMPTYNFANVIDDHLMGITHCIRGVEYLMSTPKYNELYKAFGWEPPVYIHLQPIMRDATHKLSKRDGDAGFDDFVKKGFLPEAIVNYIALLGWSPKDDREKLSMAEMLEAFSVEGLSKSSSIFDEEKMRWLNSVYMKELDLGVFEKLATPYYDKYLTVNVDRAVLSKLLQPRAEIFSDIEKLTAFLGGFDGFDLANFENKKWKTDAALAKTLMPDFKRIAAENFEDVDAALVTLAESKGLKKGQTLWCFRIAITGAQSTPGGCQDMCELLGKDEIARRLEVTDSRL